MKSQIIQSYDGDLSVSAQCKILQISTSGYYSALKRPISKRASDDQKLMKKVRFYFYRSGKAYGCKRIARDFRDDGIPCSKNRILRLMKQDGLKSTHTKTYRVMTTDSKHHMPVAKNHLNREFIADKPNQKWAGDITYIPTAQGFVYLAVILDLFSRKVVGFAIEDHMKTELCSKAFKKTVHLRRVENNHELLHHSDRGSQYASDDYQFLINKLNTTVSMSGKGNCWDNAVVEAFFKNLKTERVYQKKYQNLNHAKEDITKYINNFYNNQRRHSTLDYVSPVEYENNYYNQLKMAT